MAPTVLTKYAIPMSIKYTRVHRLLQIISLVQGQRGWTAKGLAEECGVPPALERRGDFYTDATDDRRLGKRDGQAAVGAVMRGV